MDAPFLDDLLRGRESTEGFHAVRRKRFRISEADDKYSLRSDAVRWRSEQQCLPKLPAKQIGLANLIQKTIFEIRFPRHDKMPEISSIFAASARRDSLPRFD